MRPLALVLLFACSDVNSPSEGKVGDEGLTDDSGGDAGVVGTYDSDSDWMHSKCPYEAPPTAFTGGLVYLAWLIPKGGAFTVEYGGGSLVREVGEVDWAAGTVWKERSYLEDYSVVGGRYEATFKISGNGSYDALSTSTTELFDGTTTELQATEQKQDCTTITTSANGETHESTTITETLTSSVRKDWTHVVQNDEGEGWTFDALGVSTDDWESSYDFQTDDPASDQSPDRDGTCQNHADGSSECAMSLYKGEGRWQESVNTWAVDGDWSNTWEYHDLAETYQPSTWGVFTGTRAGSGAAEWTVIHTNGTRVDCEGAWDDDGVGTWSCSDGSEGSYS